MTTPIASTPPPTTIFVRGESWLLVPEAARRLKVTTGRIYHLTTDKRLRSLVQHGLNYVSYEDLEKYKTYQKQWRALRSTGRPLKAATA
jgi:hypothetical protein